MLRCCSVLFPALLGLLPAQGSTFVPTAAVRLRVDGLAELFTALPGTHVGRLLATADAQAALNRGLEQYRSLVRRRHALLAPLRPHLAEQNGWLQQVVAEEEVWRLWHATEWSDLRTIEYSFTPERPPRTVLSFTCTPRAEGRLVAQFERIASELRQSPAWRAVGDEKIGGLPGHVLQGPEPTEEGYGGPAGLWLLHTPGQFVVGGGTPATGELVQPPAAPTPGVTIDFDIPALLQADDTGGAVDPIAMALGLPSVPRIEWSARIAGELLLDELVIHGARPEGLIGAALRGTAALPAQALPTGALLQLRIAMDLEQLPPVFEALGMAMPAELWAQLLPECTGGIALAVAAPATGGVIPRLFATIGLRSPDSAAKKLAELVPPSMRGRDVTYGGVRCTTLKLADVPAGLQPAFAVHDGRLWLAENPRSLRDLLTAQAGGAVAMDVGDAPLPPGSGEPLPTFDLRFDEGAIYRAYYDVWLPLYSLMAATQPGLQALLERADLPTPDEASPHLGRTRGVLRRRGDHHVVQHLGRLGGPVLCGYALLWGPMASASIAQPWLHESLCEALAQVQLNDAWTALAKWRDQHGSFPPDLGTLVKAGLLQPDQLLVPGDPAPDVQPLTDGRQVRSSYRYFPQTVAVNAAEGSGRMLLIAIEPSRGFGRRAMLADDGSLPQVWGDSGTQPIDQFGK